MSTRYPVSYTIEQHEGGLTAEELRARGAGGCDAVLLVSIMGGGENAPMSIVFASLDGRKGEELTPQKIFQVWAMMAHGLSQDEGLGDASRELCSVVHEAVQEAIKNGRRAEREPRN